MIPRNSMRFITITRRKATSDYGMNPYVYNFAFCCRSGVKDLKIREPCFPNGVKFDFLAEILGLPD